jgi:hypothetical protein
MTQPEGSESDGESTEDKEFKISRETQTESWPDRIGKNWAENGRFKIAKSRGGELVQNIATRHHNSMNRDTHADAIRGAPPDQLFSFSSATFDDIDGVSFDGTTKPKTNKKENKMTSQEYEDAIDRAIEFLLNRPVCYREITLNDFTTELNQSTRFMIKNEAKEFCKIFPWFHLPKRLPKSYRFRQTLATELRQGTTIDKVLQAMNYLLHLDFRQGNSLERLRECYEQMRVPIFSHYLTAIVEVYEKMVAPEVTPAPGMTQTATSTVSSLSTLESPFSLENFRCETPLLEDFDPLYKRRRICTAHTAIEKNLEMIAFYGDLLAAMPLDGPISGRQIYEGIIRDLQRANEDLRTDIIFLE